MKKALFIYRYHCMEPRRNYANQPRYRLVPGVFLHMLERVRDLRDIYNIPVEFICIADNTTDTLLIRTEKVMRDTLGINATEFIVTKSEEDIQNSEIVNYPKRRMSDGTISQMYHRGSFTMYNTAPSILKARINEDMIVFFCECDYLYKEDALIKGYQMACNHEEDFVTLYEHFQNYRCDHPYLESIKPFKHYSLQTSYDCNYRWGTAWITCLTFLGSMKTIKKNSDLFLNPSSDFADWGLWIAIGSNTFNTNPPTNLWMSIPSLAFQCDSHNMGFDVIGLEGDPLTSDIRKEECAYWLDLLQTVGSRTY